VDLCRGESFGFLGFDFRRVRSYGVFGVRTSRPSSKRTALLRKLKDVFRRYQSQPVDRMMMLINPVLRVGELLCSGAFQRVFQRREGLGRKEDPAPYAASPESTELRLDAVE
jgi:hypothetical protein